MSSLLTFTVFPLPDFTSYLFTLPGEWLMFGNTEGSHTSIVSPTPYMVYFVDSQYSPPQTILAVNLSMFDLNLLLSSTTAETKRQLSSFRVRQLQCETITVSSPHNSAGCLPARLTIVSCHADRNTKASSSHNVKQSPKSRFGGSGGREEPAHLVQEPADVWNVPCCDRGR